MAAKKPRFKAIENKRDKVAIVGFAGTTRHLAPYNNPEWEIWSLNEAHRQPWMKRITRWFQIHQRWDFTKKNNEAYVEHWEWLQKKHPFPIYMQEEHDDVPSSVKYPLEEIAEKFLSGALRGTSDDGTEVNKYFTSSFAFMCALALYEGFKKIHVFGFEMATDTEYRYQKGSTEYWLGVAAGLGVETYVPEHCRILGGAMYGYEVSRMINRQRLEFLKNRFERELKLATKNQDQINGRRIEVDGLFAGAKERNEKLVYATRSRELLEAEITANGLTNEKKGRVNMINDLIKTVDNMHAGIDPGDGYFGPEGDLDPELEAQVQAEAEAAAEQSEEAGAEPSEG